MKNDEILIEVTDWEENQVTRNNVGCGIYVDVLD